MNDERYVGVMTNAQATFQAEELWYYNIGISSSLKQMRWFDLSEADCQNAKISHKYFCLLLIDRLTNDIFCYYFLRANKNDISSMYISFNVITSFYQFMLSLKT